MNCLEVHFPARTLLFEFLIWLTDFRKVLKLDLATSFSIIVSQNLQYICFLHFKSQGPNCHLPTRHVINVKVKSANPPSTLAQQPSQGEAGWKNIYLGSNTVNSQTWDCCPHNALSTWPQVTTTTESVYVCVSIRIIMWEFSQATSLLFVGCGLQGYGMKLCVCVRGMSSCEVSPSAHGSQ